MLEPLRHIQNPEFRALIFRRTYKQIEQEEGLWSTSSKIYPYAGGSPSFGNLLWKFKSGATIRFSHMENEDDRFNHLGAGVAFLGFDEIQTFSPTQFFFLFSSLRSMSGIAPYIRCTCNPLSNSWLSRFIEWWWDQETGYPIEQRSGVVRWFIRHKESIVWGDTAQQLKSDFPGSYPMSATFIPAKVYDNQILLKKNPTYIASLQALNQVDRERYLHGNWKISESSGNIFRREWFRIINEPPAGLTQFVRAWDCAATEPKPGRDPDWTCGVLLSVKDGVWYILDIQRFRGTPRVVEERMKQVAESDPYGTRIRYEREPGASGLTAEDHYARYVLVGYDFKGVPSLKNKQLRANPASSAAEAGNMVLVRGPWNTAFLDEAESFKGLDEKNDQIDALSLAVNELKGASGDWKFALPVATSNYDRLVPASMGRYDRIGTM